MTTSTTGMVRVTVTSGSRRVDLRLPGSVPVAELLPELARSVGVLDAAAVHGGYRLVTAEGRVLGNDTGLILQGIEDGAVLSVSAGVQDEPPRVYDDVVEAMADAVEQELTPWSPATGRRTTLVAGGLLLVLGAVAVLMQRAQGSLVAPVVGTVAAVALVTAAVVLGRVQQEREAAVGMAWMAALWGAVAGFTWFPHDLLLGMPTAAAGMGMLVIGSAAVLGLVDGRALVVPAIVAGGIAAVAGLVMGGLGWDPGATLAVVLVLVVIAGSVLPWLALSTTRTDVDQVHEVADITADPEPVDPEAVSQDARVGHEILLGISATVGIVLVLTVPVVVSQGVWGALLAVVACGAVMIRTRQYRNASQVLTGLVAGIAGLVVTAVASLLVHPDWRPAVAVVLAVAGAGLLVLTLLASGPSVRRGRLGDIGETASLVTLLPLMVMAAGFFDMVRG